MRSEEEEKNYQRSLTPQEFFEYYRAVCVRAAGRPVKFYMAPDCKCKTCAHKEGLGCWPRCKKLKNIPTDVYFDNAACGDYQPS